MKSPGRDYDRLVESRNRWISFIQEGLPKPLHELTQPGMVSLVQSNLINGMESLWSNSLTIGSAITDPIVLVSKGFLTCYGVGRITVCQAGGWSPLRWPSVPRRARGCMTLRVSSSCTPSPTPRSTYCMRNRLRNHGDEVCANVDLREV